MKEVKTSTIIAVSLIVIFLAVGAVGWVKSLNPYVTIAQAKASPSTVQVKGELMKSTIGLDPYGTLNFHIRDKTGDLKVVYMDSKPGNLEQASHVVAVGKYHDEVFEAEQLIVKCPSKYQGTTSGSK